MSIAKMWNEKFSREGYLYGKKPNAFLASELKKLPKGSKILFLGEGEGRSACYAASLGFDVTTLDASEVGLKKSRQLAKEMGVSIKTIHLDLEHWQPDEQYDAVLSSFLHLRDPLRTKTFRSLLDALKDSGVFIAEFFTLNQLKRDSGGPKMSELLYTKESLLNIFDLPHAEILYLEELVDFLDEGSGHQGDAELIRIIVRKSGL